MTRPVRVLWSIVDCLLFKLVLHSRISRAVGYRIGVWWCWTRLEYISLFKVLPFSWCYLGMRSFYVLLIFDHLNKWFRKLLWLLLVQEFCKAWLSTHVVVTFYWAMWLPWHVFVWLSHHFPGLLHHSLGYITSFKSLRRVFLIIILLVHKVLKFFWWSHFKSTPRPIFLFNGALRSCWCSLFYKLLEVWLTHAFASLNSLLLHGISFLTGLDALLYQFDFLLCHLYFLL